MPPKPGSKKPPRRKYEADGKDPEQAAAIAYSMAAAARKRRGAK